MRYRFARYYSRLLEPNTEPNAQLRIALHRINRLEVNTAYPFFLNCYATYDEGNLSSDEFLGLISVIENFIVRRFVCGVPTNQLNKIFPTLYSQATKGKGNTLSDKVKAILQKRGYPKDIEFRQRLVGTKLYGAGDRQRKTKLILESLEKSFGHKETVSFEDLTIEHVMPQTLTDWWQNHLGEDWDVTYDLSLHTLGNLTLTAYNTELSNDEYPIKQARLMNSHLEINKFFSDSECWRREDIERRGKELAERCVSIWPFFGEDTVTNDGGEVTGKVPHTLWILGQSFCVYSWRDVLENTLNTVAKLEPEKFDILLQDFPRLVSKDPTNYRATSAKRGIC